MDTSQEQEQNIQIELEDILGSMRATIGNLSTAHAMSEARVMALQRELDTVRAERDQLAAILAERTAHEAGLAETNGKAPAKP